MPDNDADDIERRHADEAPDDSDSGPILSFDFDETPMPHWSEPGSAQVPDGGERPDPPEIETKPRQGSRLFPQLPDDPHLVDTSDTGLMDALRSDTIPTVTPVAESELFDTGPMDVEGSVVTSGGRTETGTDSNGDELWQSEPSTDELFHGSLFGEDSLDASIFDDVPIIGSGIHDEAPLLDTGTMSETVADSLNESDATRTPDDRLGFDTDEDDAERFSVNDQEGFDASELRNDSLESENHIEHPDTSNIDSTGVQSDAFVDEPTAELILEEEERIEIEDATSDNPDEFVSHDQSHQTEEEKPSTDELRRPPRVIELFDTPPSQRAMRTSQSTGIEDNANEGHSRENDHGDGDEWAHFGGPAPHWREDRRDYEEPEKVSEDDRVVTHTGSESDRPMSPTESRGRNLPLAIVVGLALGAAFFGLLKVGPWAALCMVILALGIAAMEFFVSARNLGYRPAALLGIAAVAGLSLGAYHRGYAAYPVVLGLTVLTGMCWFLFDVDSEHVTANLAVTLLGAGWIGGLGSFAALILAQPNGDAVLIGAVLGTVAYDVGGYVIGSTTGQSKLAPRVSPNKTYEGLVGGMMLAVVVTTLVLNRFPGIHPWSQSMMDCLWLGLAIAIVAPIGDLAQSMIKRDMGVKDMGTLLPGHGGVLDRFDALLFVLPTTYFVADLVLS